MAQRKPKKVHPVAREIATTAEGEELIIDATVQAFNSPGGFAIGAVLSLDRITSGPLTDEPVSPEPPTSG